MCPHVLPSWDSWYFWKSVRWSHLRDRDQILSSGFLGYQASMWYTYIHTGKHLYIFKKRTHKSLKREKRKGGIWRQNLAIPIQASLSTNGRNTATVRTVGALSSTCDAPETVAETCCCQTKTTRGVSHPSSTLAEKKQIYTKMRFSCKLLTYQQHLESGFWESASGGTGVQGYLQLQSL